jgi:hypothetical protein
MRDGGRERKLCEELGEVDIVHSLHRVRIRRKKNPRDQDTERNKVRSDASPSEEKGKKTRVRCSERDRRSSVRARKKEADCPTGGEAKEERGGIRKERRERRKDRSKTRLSRSLRPDLIGVTGPTRPGLCLHRVLKFALGEVDALALSLNGKSFVSGSLEGG